MDTSARSMIEFFDKIAATGRMKPESARSLVVGVKQVFKMDESWEEIDVSQLDIEEYLIRFRNLNHLRYKGETLDEYERRFKRAIELYLLYVRDPKGWKFEGQPSVGRKTSTRTKNTKLSKESQLQAPDTLEISPLGITPSGIQLMDYPFPLRDGCVVRLRLPIDLKVSEVERLAAFMKTVTTDFTVG